MELDIQSKQLRVDGMTCASCQSRIEKKLRSTAGVRSVKASYSAGTVDIAYDTGTVSLDELGTAIEKLGYQVLAYKMPRAANVSRAVGLLVIIVALFLVIQQFGILNLLVPSQLADANMGFAMIFVIGLVTSVHCIAMCGGINLSQCIAKEDKPGSGQGADGGAAAAGGRGAGGGRAGGAEVASIQAAKQPGTRKGADAGKLGVLWPSLLYNLGRVASYTIIGFIVGALGSAITFSAAMQGELKLIAGIFMAMMGLGMLGIFPWLHKLTPRMPKAIASRIDAKQSRSKSPLIVGLLNGLMPCGPLQAMQMYALSTGSAFAGALSMFLFSAGTVPLMFGLGTLSTILSKRFTRKLITVGAVLVVVLGLSMFSQGWSLSGIKLPESSAQPTAAQPSGSGNSTDTGNGTGTKIENGVQIVNSSLARGSYPDITVQAGTPVKWLINAPRGSINGCNNRMLIDEYGIEHSFELGENVIEFTPSKTGTIRYSCWMGMIHGTIKVVDS
jgi:sulfite exporter TauE/SafE/copper chaperone CopZ